MNACGSDVQMARWGVVYAQKGVSKNGERGAKANKMVSDVCLYTCTLPRCGQLTLISIPTASQDL